MKTYNIVTIGCQMNRSDSERISGYLESHGFKLVDDKYQADLVVFVTCGVRQSAEDRIYGLIPDIKKKNPKCKIILTGCLSRREDVKRRLGKNVDVILPIEKIFNFQFSIFKQFSISKFNKLNEGNLRNDTIYNCGYLNMKPKNDSKFIAYVPIGNGCNNFCSYCVVPYARGREVYRPAEEIIDEAKDLIKKGYKEIVLIAQNVNSYKGRILRDKYLMTDKIDKSKKNINFTELLRTINKIDGDFWIRFSTSHPKDMSDDLIHTVASCGKVCKHIHLPAQSGDDSILKMMNRKYKVRQYINLVRKIRTQVDVDKNTDGHGKKIWQPPVAITTDIIVGFPSETKKQFANTKELFRQIKFDMAYISKYSSRPGTMAEKLNDNVSAEEKKRRDIKLNNVLSKTALSNNKKYLGKIVKVLVESKNKRGEYFGKTETSKNVRINPLKSGSEELIGKFASIKINKILDFGLEGVLLEYDK